MFHGSDYGNRRETFGIAKQAADDDWLGKLSGFRDETDAAAKDQEEKLQKALEEIRARLEKETEAKAEWSGSDYDELKAAVEAAFADSQIKAVLQETTDLVDDFSKSLQDLTGSAIDSTRLREVRQAATMNLSWLNDIPDDVDGALREALSTAFTTPISRQELYAKLAEKLSGGNLTSAIRALGDAINQIKQGILAAYADQFDFDGWYYAGPPAGDIVIREFCEYMTQRAYTTEALMGCSNGMLPNVMVTCGGYGCRHTLYPVKLADLRITNPKLVVDDYHYEEEIISPANSQTGREARIIRFVVEN